MLINKGFAGSPMTDMTEMTAFSHPHTCARTRIYILFTCHFCHKEKKKKKKIGKSRVSGMTAFLQYLSFICHKPVTRKENEHESGNFDGEINQRPRSEIFAGGETDSSCKIYACS